MPELEIIVDPQAVNDYLEAYDLTEDFADLSAVLLQLHGMVSGLPAVMFVIEVDGEKVLAKTSYRMFMGAVGAIQGTLARLEDEAKIAAAIKSKGN